MFQIIFLNEMYDMIRLRLPLVFGHAFSNEKMSTSQRDADAFLCIDVYQKLEEGSFA